MKKEHVYVSWDNWSGIFIMHLPGQQTNNSEKLIKMRAKRFYKHTKRKTHEKEKRFLNTALIVFMFVWYIAAFVLWSVGADSDNMIMALTGAGMFPLGGLIMSVNAVKYALKDLKGWRRIFTKPRLPQKDEFYVVEDPSFLHKALTRAVLKEQLLNIIVMIVVPIFLLVYNGYVAKYAKFSRTQGRAGFVFGFILIFGLPLFSYSLTNFVYRLRVVKHKEYIAYHAVVRGIHDNRLTIFEKSKYCVFKYSNCIGMHQKDVHDTPGVLIFVPDEVYFFPDKIFRTDASKQ